MPGPLTKSEWIEFADASEMPSDDLIDFTVSALYESLARTNTALQNVLSMESVRDADEIITANNKLLS